MYIIMNTGQWKRLNLIAPSPLYLPWAKVYSEWGCQDSSSRRICFLFFVCGLVGALTVCLMYACDTGHQQDLRVCSWNIERSNIEQILLCVCKWQFTIVYILVWSGWTCLGIMKGTFSSSTLSLLLYIKFLLHNNEALELLKEMVI